LLRRPFDLLPKHISRHRLRLIAGHLHKCFSAPASRRRFGERQTSLAKFTERERAPVLLAVRS
jgi:hypothetical protein